MVHSSLYYPDLKFKCVYVFYFFVTSFCFLWRHGCVTPLYCITNGILHSLRCASIFLLCLCGKLNHIDS